MSLVLSLGHSLVHASIVHLYDVRVHVLYYRLLCIILCVACVRLPVPPPQRRLWRVPRPTRMTCAGWGGGAAAAWDGRVSEGCVGEGWCTHDANVGHVPVGERLGHAPAHVVAHVEAARAAVDVRELEARLAHRRRVDDRHHLLEVLAHEPVEERLVAALQTCQERVLAEIARLRGGKPISRTQAQARIISISLSLSTRNALRDTNLPAEVGVGASYLLLNRVDLWRQETAKAEYIALALRKRST